MQSAVNDSFKDSLKKQSAPLSHQSYNKHQKPKDYMIEGRPLFQGQSEHVSNINAGRARIFYSSNVF